MRWWQNEVSSVCRKSGVQLGTDRALKIFSETPLLNSEKFGLHGQSVSNTDMLDLEGGWWLINANTDSSYEEDVAHYDQDVLLAPLPFQILFPCAPERLCPTVLDGEHPKNNDFIPECHRAQFPKALVALREMSQPAKPPDEAFLETRQPDAREWRSTIGA